MHLFGYIAQTRHARCHLFAYLAHMLTLGIGVSMSKYPLPMLSSLRAFEAAARHQSIKKACDELHVTHAAVTRHLQKLERQLRRRLFDRRHRSIVLTDDGKILFDAVSLGFSHIQRAIVQLSGNQNPERLVISVDPDFAGLWLVPRLAELQAIVPNTFVEILAEKGTNSLLDPRIHCAIHYAEAGREVQDGEILFRSHLFPVCAPCLTQVLPLRSPEDLRHHVLLHDRSIVEWQEYLQSCSMTVDVRPGPVFSDTALCMEAAARGQGVAIGDDFLAAIYLSEGRLVRLFEPSFLSKNSYYFVVPKRSASHPAVDMFRTWLFHGVNRLRNEPVHPRDRNN
jgi:LysR family glycine cleavage system transcriptional activator